MQQAPLATSTTEGNQVLPNRLLDKKSYFRILATLAESNVNGGLTVNTIISRLKDRFNKNCSLNVAEKILISLRGIESAYSLKGENSDLIPHWGCTQKGLTEYNYMKINRKNMLDSSSSPGEWMHI